MHVLIRIQSSHWWRSRTFGGYNYKGRFLLFEVSKICFSICWMSFTNHINSLSTFFFSWFLNKSRSSHRLISSCDKDLWGCTFHKSSIEDLLCLVKCERENIFSISNAQDRRWMQLTHYNLEHLGNFCSYDALIIKAVLMITRDEMCPCNEKVPHSNIQWSYTMK